MAIWYVDLAAGTDANPGTSWGAAKKSMNALALASGDEVRFAKTADPVLLGNATWTDGSKIVQFSSPPVGLAVGMCISKSGLAVIPDGVGEGWWYVTAISGSNVTIDGLGYAHNIEGHTETVPTYARATVTTTQQDIPDVGAAGQPLSLLGGFNAATGEQDGETFLHGAGSGFGFYTPNYPDTDYRRRQFVAMDRLSLVGWNVGMSVTIDDAAIRIPCLAGNKSDGFYQSDSRRGSWRFVHVLGNGTRAAGRGLTWSGSMSLAITIDNLLSNGYRGVDGDSAWFGTQGAYLHHCYGGMAAPYDFGPNVFTFGRVINNGGHGIEAESWKGTTAELGLITRNGASGLGLDPYGHGFLMHGDGANAIHIARASKNALHNIQFQSATYDTVVTVDYVDQQEEGRGAVSDGTVPLLGQGAQGYIVLPDLLIYDPPAPAGGSIALKGIRKAGADVVVTCPTATPGAVTYPTTDTWACTVSALGAGDNEITVALADASASSSLTAQGAVPVLAQAVAGTGSIGPVEWTSSEGIPLRDSASGKWCPIRYRANGKPIFLRRS